MILSTNTEPVLLHIQVIYYNTFWFSDSVLKAMKLHWKRIGCSYCSHVTINWPASSLLKRFSFGSCRLNFVGGFSGLHRRGNGMLCGVEALQVPTPQDTERWHKQIWCHDSCSATPGEVQVTEMVVRCTFNRCSLWGELVCALFFFLEAKLLCGGEHNKFKCRESWFRILPTTPVCHEGVVRSLKESPSKVFAKMIFIRIYKMWHPPGETSCPWFGQVHSSLDKKLDGWPSAESGGEWS